MNICWIGCPLLTPLSCSKNAVILPHRNCSQHVVDSIPEQQGNQHILSLWLKWNGSGIGLIRFNRELWGFCWCFWYPSCEIWGLASLQSFMRRGRVKTELTQRMWNWRDWQLLSFIMRLSLKPDQAIKSLFLFVTLGSTFYYL